MARHKNITWNCGDPADRTPSVDHAQLAVLMDIRDELQALNRILQCPNFQRLPLEVERARKAAERVDKRLSKRIRLK